MTVKRPWLTWISVLELNTQMLPGGVLAEATPNKRAGRAGGIMGQEQYRGGGGHVTSGSYPSLPLLSTFLVSSSRAAAGRASLNVATQYIHSHIEIDQPKESCDEEPTSSTSWPK